MVFAMPLELQFSLALSVIEIKRASNSGGTGTNAM